MINMKTKSQILEELEEFAQLMPVNLYWMDTNGVFLGGNDLTLSNSGAQSKNETFGKTYADFQPPELAKPIIENLKRVISIELAIMPII